MKIQVRHCHAQREEWLRFHGDGGERTERGRRGSTTRSTPAPEPPPQNPGQPLRARQQISVQAGMWRQRQSVPQSRSWWRRFLLVHVFRSDKQGFNSSPDLLVIEIPVEEACHI